MKTWLPLWIGLGLALVINLFPLFMAFVVDAKGWRFVGWAYYFFTFPIGIALVVIGLVISIIRAL